MVKEVEKWWNESSDSFQKGYFEPNSELTTAHYGVHAPSENNLKLLGNIRGKRILEVGCGGAQCSIAFAKKGAICTGIDLSREQLKHAEGLVKKHGVRVRLVRGDFHDLGMFKPNSFDIAFSAWAFQYSPNLKKLFKQVHRVLKKGGLFVFSTEHPFYMTMDDKTQKMRRSYFKTGRYEEMETWPDGSRHKFVSYRTKVSDIFNSLVDAGFRVERILEPLSIDEKLPEMEEKQFPTSMAKMVGPTIIFKARK